MKKIIVFPFLLLLGSASFSQQTKPAPALTKQDYLKKSKSQRTVAWILLGTGTALITTGVIVGFHDATEAVASVIVLNPKSSPNRGGVFLFTGLAVAAGSIPFFIAAHRNIKKYASLSFKNETAPQIQKSSLAYTYVPSLTLKISL